MHAAAAWHPVASGTTKDLFAIWGAAEDDVWAVGAARERSCTTTARRGPRRRRSRPRACAPSPAPGATDAWAVGEDGVALHWDGRAWHPVFDDFVEDLSGVAGLHPDDMWAVSLSDRPVPTILHWDGTAWSPVERTTTVPLYMIVVVGPDEAWTAGTVETLLHHVPVR